MTNRDLAELRDPEHKQAEWWCESWCYNNAGESENMGDIYTGPDWHASDDACFRDWRPVLLAAGCRIECILDRTNMPRTCVVFGLSILDAGPTYRTPVLAAVAWLAEHKPELLREAIAQVEEGK